MNGEIPFWCIKISIPEIFRNTERLNGYTTKFIGTMRHKKNRKNPWCSPALVCEKFFDTIFPRIRERLSYDFLRHYETKNVRPKLVTPPYYALNLFDTRKILKQRSVLQCFFTTVRQKFLTEPWCPPPLHENFGTRYFFETQNGSLTNFLGTVKRKYVDRKSWCRSPFSSSHNFISIPESFWNDEGFPNEVFQCCETKVFRKTCDIPSYASKFYVSDFFWNAEGFPYQFSRCYETQKNFRQNCDVTTPPPGPSYAWQFSTPEVFWNTDLFPYDIYR